jgi:hypothetical protein
VGRGRSGALLVLKVARGTLARESTHPPTLPTNVKCGGGGSASQIRASADLDEPSAAARRRAGRRFSLTPADPPHSRAALGLLRSWSDLHPRLLAALAAAESGVAEVRQVEGLRAVSPATVATAYAYAADDVVAEALKREPAFLAFSRPMLEACFCFLATPGPATLRL